MRKKSILNEDHENRTGQFRIETHPWEPFYPPGTRLLILGSFPPPPKRWSMEFYYPNWLNDFWRMIGLVFFDDVHRFELAGQKAFDEKRIKSFLADKKIGMHDVGTKVIRHKENASDLFLEIVEAIDPIETFRTLSQCRAIVTTGQKSSDVFAEQIHKRLKCEVASPGVGQCIIIHIEGQRTACWYRMPSTSRAYPKPLKEKTELWQRMFREMELV
ncbi:MAG: uracil-DNA glycosylase family protein [Thermoguttaceae bacterium]|nr:uracil-DNA glycosylase family protein [Thermoguttaceae bacterium]